MTAVDGTAGQAARQAVFTARCPWVQITPPRYSGMRWRASWLVPPEQGGAEEITRQSRKILLDYLEAVFPPSLSQAPH